ncbi:MAG: acetyltransferase [Acidimicrobiales bacterium]|nr:acetyltransferase [Acidimicrobiales bacterium]
MGDVDDAALLEDIDRYLDRAPRLAATTEDHGPLTLFVGEPAGAPFYARPRHANRAPVRPDHVSTVRERQRQLRVPEVFEWIRELDPTMAAACRSAGLAVVDHPLLVLDHLVEPPASHDVSVELLAAKSDDGDLAATLAVPPVAFAVPTDRDGSAGHGTAPVAIAATRVAATALRALRRRFDEGTMRSAVARVDGQVVAVASAIPSGGVAEIVAVATLPAYRRRGCAAAATARVAAAVSDLGVGTTFLSAGDRAATRMYEQLGFRRIATSAVAEP